MITSCYLLVSVPDPKPTPAQIAFSILEAIYALDEVWRTRLVIYLCYTTIAFLGDNLSAAA